MTKLQIKSLKIKLENNRFFLAIEIALKNDWASTDDEQKYWLKLIEEAINGDKKSLKLLRQEFKFNLSFKQKTGVFKNV